MPEIKGSCLCGQVSYVSTEAEPKMTAVCHCPDCQKQTGTAFSVNVLVPTASVKLTGPTLGQYTMDGASGQPVRRNFCTNCGSPLSTELDAFDHLSAIKVGTLDDNSWVKPTVQIWCDSSQPWAVLDDTLPQVGKNPG